MINNNYYHFSCHSRSFKPRLLGHRLSTRIIGKRIYFYKTIRSTQKLALSIAEKNPTASNGTVIIAEQQTHGIGRAGRKWISPPGGVWLSVILKPNLLSSQSMLIMFLATITVCEVIKAKTGLDTKIKWPNDVTINGRKVSGTLVDLTMLNEAICYAVIGIGINVNNETAIIDSELATGKEGRSYNITPTSLKKELNSSDISLQDFTKSLLEQLEYYYDRLQKGFHHEILTKWKNISQILNKSIMIREQNKIFEGIVKDIDYSGAVIVKACDGTKRKIFAPDIILKSDH